MGQTINSCHLNVGESVDRGLEYLDPEKSTLGLYDEAAIYEPKLLTVAEF